jgi:3-phosphoshikimate 1-carboxyvinyltransferase
VSDPNEKVFTFDNNRHGLRGQDLLPEAPSTGIVSNMASFSCTTITHPLDAEVCLPGSKSISNRALLAAALADGVSRLDGLLLAEDTRLMIDALRALGVRLDINEAESSASVHGCSGELPASSAELYCGNSGTTMRLCTALVALGHGRYTLDGRPRMRKRPLGGLIGALSDLGVRIVSLEQPGYPPITVESSGLVGGKTVLHSPDSSQFLSALMMVAPYAESDLVIEVTGDVPSQPYLALTVALMRRFGVTARLKIKPSGMELTAAASQRYRATTFTIEPDASNATYFLAAPAIVGGCVTVRNLGTGSIQGDAAFVDILEQMGCVVTRAVDRLSVSGPPAGTKLCGVDVDLCHMPDTVQTLAVVALFADGPTRIRNVANLRVKETDRLAALTCELTKLGASVVEERSGLTVTPPARILPARIDTYDDHRMAMSFALTGLAIPGIHIENPECCGKSFPEFFDCFEKMAGLPDSPK